MLLIVFMVAAPMLLSGIPATPPEGVNLAAHPDDPADLTLGIDRDGGYYLGRQPIARDALEPRLRAMFAARPADHVLYVRADRGLRYGVVQDAVEVAARSGARVVGFITEQRRTARP